MSDETIDSTEPTTAPATESGSSDSSESPPDAQSAALGLMADIAERVKTSAPLVRQRFIDSQVDKEVSDRVGLLDRGMQKRFQLKNDLKKIDFPDQVFYDQDKKPVMQGYTKPRLEEIRKAKEALGKFEGILERAISKDDWSKLKEAIK